MPFEMDSTISIHAPREGGDVWDDKRCPPVHKFQSTPPARGATYSYHHNITEKNHFNPRPPRGGRPMVRPSLPTGRIISIHAPREGGDYRCELLANGKHISIHAPREGGDGAVKATIPAGGISIHAPREGGRHRVSGNAAPVDRFQSTPPARGATQLISFPSSP